MQIDSTLQIQTQAIINIIVAQRNSALDQCATLVGRIAVLEAQFKGVSDELGEIKAELEKLKAAPSPAVADDQAVTVG